MNTRTGIATELLKGLLMKEAVEGRAAEDEIVGKALRMADILIRKGSGGTAAEPGRPMSVREAIVRTVSSLVRKCGPVDLVDDTGRPTLTAFRFGTEGVRAGVYAVTGIFIKFNKKNQDETIVIACKPEDRTQTIEVNLCSEDADIFSLRDLEAILDSAKTYHYADADVFVAMRTEQGTTEFSYPEVVATAVEIGYVKCAEEICDAAPESEEEAAENDLLIRRFAEKYAEWAAVGQLQGLTVTYKDCKPKKIE